MLNWIAATVCGLGLGLALYACVRLRMHFGPIVQQRFGKVARQLYWLVTIGVMVLLANLGLILLRGWLAEYGPDNKDLMLEIWFALLALAISLLLIFRQLKSDNCEPVEE